MSRFNQRYDEIKDLVKKARVLNEQLNAEKLGPLNVASDIEASISDDEYELANDNNEKEAKEDYIQRYKISGSVLAIHGPTKSDTDITSDDKLAFQD